jgi:hypothetical protein
MISAVFALVPPDAPGFDAARLAALFTVIGAAGFLIGSLLMLPETAVSAISGPLASGVTLGGIQTKNPLHFALI